MFSVFWLCSFLVGSCEQTICCYHAKVWKVQSWKLTGFGQTSAPMWKESNDLLLVQGGDHPQGSFLMMSAGELIGFKSTLGVVQTWVPLCFFLGGEVPLTKKKNNGMFLSVTPKQQRLARKRGPNRPVAPSDAFERPLRPLRSCNAPTESAEKLRL